MRNDPVSHRCSGLQKIGFLLIFIVVMGHMQWADAANVVAPFIELSTENVPRWEQPDPAVNDRKLWKVVVPDAALRKTIDIYRSAQNTTNAKAVAAGFEPASVDSQNGGQFSTYYIDFQEGPNSDANAFSGLDYGVRSVWYNHASFTEPGRTPTDNLYTISHEFFHSIFNPIVKKRGYWAIPTATRYKWMSEGIPTAVGQIAMEGFEGTSLKERARTGSRLGVRALGARYLDYPIDLRDEYPLPTTGLWFSSNSSPMTATVLSYATSSFWHFVINESGGMKWLKNFMARAKPAEDSADGWIDWVEKGIQDGNHFANFAEAYNRYMAQFVDYPYLVKNNVQQDYFAWGKWQSLLFHEGCRSIEVKAGDPAVEHVATIRPLSSECVRVKVVGLPPKAANIHVTLAGATDQICKDVNVLSGNKTALQLPKIQKDGSCDWHWQFLYDPLTPQAQGEQVFVITNVNPTKASKTKMLRAVPIKFSVPALTVTATGAVPASNSGILPPGTYKGVTPSQPTPPKKLSVPSKVSAKADKIAVVGHNNNELESPLKYQGSECDAMTRALRPCGPYTKLEFHWGDIADLEVETVASQYDVVGGDFSAMGAMMSKLGSAATNVERFSGGSVMLEFPRIEKGFSGSFNNAVISLGVDHKGESGSLEALSPQFIYPGHNPDCPHANAIYPYNGQVTISNYDASGISGSFRADFYDSSEQDCPVPVKAASVSGRFRLGAIYDEAQQEYQDTAEGEKRLNALLVAKFYSMVPPTLTAGIRATSWAAFAQQMAAKSGGSGGSGSGPSLGGASNPVCSCSSEEFFSPKREACAAQCVNYGPVAANYVQMREIAKGRTEKAVLDQLNACASTCSTLRASSATLTSVCADAFYPIRKMCAAAGPGGVTPKQINCYLDYIVRELDEPQKSQFRKTQADQIATMDPDSKDFYFGSMLDALRNEGMNCSPP